MTVTLNADMKKDLEIVHKAIEFSKDNATDIPWDATDCFWYLVSEALTRIEAAHTEKSPSYQKRIQNWMMECFSMEVCRDKTERNHRFLEESLELVQSLDCTKSEAHQLVDYVFNRPVGDPIQEVGGVRVTLEALCCAADIDTKACAELELNRITDPVVMQKIRDKQAAKPKYSPLPEDTETGGGGMNEAADKIKKAEWIINQYIDEADNDGTAEITLFDLNVIRDALKFSLQKDEENRK